MANYILVMDQGTTGSRGVVYDEKGKTVAIDYEEYEQFFPNSGWWEQSGKTVWEVTLRTSRNAIKKAGLTGKDIAAIGIANQRETTTIWDKATGEKLDKDRFRRDLGNIEEAYIEVVKRLTETKA